MRLGRNVAITASVGLVGLAVGIGYTTPVHAEDKPAGAFAIWKAAHPNVDAQIADLKAKTAAMVGAAVPLPAAAQSKYTDLAARSAALSPQQKEQAKQLFAEGYRHWEEHDFAGAKKLLAKGLEIDPASGPGNFYMGDLQVRLGDNAGAALSLDRAMVLAPNTREGTKATIALPSVPVPVVEDPVVEKPPVIWKVPGAIDEIWDNADAPRMVVIPAGEYTMGSPASEPGHESSESPRHRVRIAYPLAVGKYPVTVGQFARFVAETGTKVPNVCQTFFNGSWIYGDKNGWNKPDFPQTDESPVICVNWYESQAYAAWLSKKTGHTYRLLSESEYEYVTRAGTATPYWWGDNPNSACGMVNVADLDAKAVPQLAYWNVGNCHDGYAFTAPANSFKPNPFGLYGISGNSLAFVQDCWTDSYNGVPSDGSPHLEDHCTEPVIRGGSWADNGPNLRSSYRNWNHDWIHFSTNGIRVARVL